MRIKGMISKMNSLDMLTTSPNYFHLKRVKSRKESLYFDVGD